MSEVLKSVLAMFLVILIAAAGASILVANQESTAAGDYLEEVSRVIAESNYSMNVIQACMEEAAANGYTLNVDVIGASVPGMKRYAEVTLEYYYEVSMFGVSDLKTRKKIV